MRSRQLSSVVISLILNQWLFISDSACAQAQLSVAKSEPPPDLCTSEIFCRGDLLHRVQLAGFEEDSKAFVDFYLRFDEAQVLQNYNNLLQQTNNNPSKEELQTFVESNFEDENDELQVAELKDWGNQQFLRYNVQCDNYKNWVDALNRIWLELAREVSNKTRLHPERHSLILVDHPFVVAGGRFREMYYWDSYWIIEGLLLSGMKDTARGMILNFASIVDRYGFVPNGNRIYYLMRSQPPLLTWMVEKYYEFTNDWQFVLTCLDALHKEFSYWVRYKRITINVDGLPVTMFRYVTNSNGPRPESYREDYNIAQLLPGKRRSYFYRNIKASAETGWDFSVRWVAELNGKLSWNLTDVVTEDIIPVDLNAIMQKNARILAGWFDKAGQVEYANFYKYYANYLNDALELVNWDPQEGVWFDYDRHNQKRRPYFYPSNLAPLYTLSYEPRKAEFLGRRVLEYLQRSKALIWPGGIPTSLRNSRQQWDFPNGWAPLQSMVVQGLRQTGYPPAMKAAREVAEKWLASNYAAYLNSSTMYEKYLVTGVGQVGGGGEYEVQKGFGWTNGVALEFLNTYPDMTCPDQSNYIESIARPSERPKVEEAPDDCPIIDSIWKVYYSKRHRCRPMRNRF